MQRSTFIKLISVSAVGAVTAHNFIPFDFPVDYTAKTPKSVVDDMMINIAGCNLHSELTSSEGEINELCESSVLKISKDGNVVIVNTGTEERAFQKVVSYFDNNSGAKLLAVREIALQDAKQYNDSDCKGYLTPINNDLRILCSGLLNTKDIKINADQDCAFEILQGRVSPQIYVVKEQALKGDLAGYLKDNPGLNVKIFGHSLGSSNALYLKHVLSSDKNVGSCQAMLFEPFGTAQLAHHILKEQGSSVNADAFVANLAKNVISIRSNPPTYVARTYLENAVGNKEFGEASYGLDYMAGSSYRQPYVAGVTTGAAAGSALTVALAPKLSNALYNFFVRAGKAAEGYSFMRRKVERSKFLSELLKVTIAGGAINSLAEVGGMAQNMSHDDNHRMPLAFSLLHVKGVEVLLPCKAEEVLATVEEIKDPEAHYRGLNGRVINGVASIVTGLSGR